MEINKEKNMLLSLGGKSVLLQELFLKVYNV